MQDAVDTVVRTSLPEGSGGLIAVDGIGSIVMDFNCTGMFRAACDSEGHFCIGIYYRNEPLELSAKLPESLRHLSNIPPEMRRSMADLTIAGAEEVYVPVDWLEYSTVVPHPDMDLDSSSEEIEVIHTEGVENLTHTLRRIRLEMVLKQTARTPSEEMAFSDRTCDPMCFKESYHLANKMKRP
jgi:hypothetical protein